MFVYITYDRYERDEWYSISHIETNKKRAIKHFLEEDLPDFISYGPDDCHSFQLQRVQMTKEEYLKLCHINEEGTDEDVKEFLMPIYNGNDYDDEIIFSTDGCSDLYEMMEYYRDNYLLHDPNVIELNLDDDELDSLAYENLYNDEELFEAVLKEYIKKYY